MPLNPDRVTPIIRQEPVTMYAHTGMPGPYTLCTTRSAADANTLMMTPYQPTRVSAMMKFTNLPPVLPKANPVSM